jgi:hypothetical protein
VCVIAVVLIAGALAQTPNFAGTWVEDQAARKTTLPSPPAGARSMTLPETDTVVKQTAADVITERKFMAHVTRFVYHLDGSESVNKNGANTLTTRSRWDGAKLVTTGTSFSATSAGEFLWQFKEVRSLDKSGALVIETTTTDEAGKTNVVTQVFRRKRQNP